MNYRHAFHAGNFADVVKHAVLALVLEHFKRKEAPFFVLDTHAGIGGYDLGQGPAARTGEFRDGIARVLQAPAVPPELAPYLGVVRALNPEGLEPLRWYPGSPRLAQALLRPQDRLVLVELHPEDGQSLKQACRGDRRVAVHLGDGYQALAAHLPPRERRGLVLIDPPFEARDEYQRLADALAKAWRRWPGGSFIVWYPIKERPAVWRFQQQVEDAGISRVLRAELTIRAEERADQLNGTGLLLINPPWRLDQTLTALLPWLQTTLAQAPGGTTLVDWLVPEAGGLGGLSAPQP